MEIDLALINELEDFNEDYEEVYLKIIREACKELDIQDDLELQILKIYKKLIKNIEI